MARKSSEARSGSYSSALHLNAMREITRPTTKQWLEKEIYGLGVQLRSGFSPLRLTSPRFLYTDGDGSGTFHTTMQMVSTDVVHGGIYTGLAANFLSPAALRRRTLPTQTLRTEHTAVYYQCRS